MRALLAVAVLALAGCAPPGGGTPRAKEPQAAVSPPRVEYNVGFRSSTGIVEFSLMDGTRCVAADYHGTAIACDWQRPVVLVPRVQ